MNKRTIKTKARRYGIFQLLVAILAAFTLVACGSSGSNSESDEQSDTQHTTTVPSKPAESIEPEPFSGVLFETGQSAAVVIGQINFQNKQTGVGAAETGGHLFGNPAVAGEVLYLTDTDNHRILGFNSLPTDNGSSADFVLGQADFNRNDAGLGRSGLNQPMDVSADNGVLAISDFGNSRVLLFFSTPQHNGAEADVVVGFPDFDSSLSDAVSEPCDEHLRSPESSMVVNNMLFVANTGRNTVYIWHSLPTENGQAPDVILGVEDINDCRYTSVNAQTFDHPSGIWSDGTRLAVLDTGNSRVLIWNEIPTQHSTPADIVLGQSSFFHWQANDIDQDSRTDRGAGPRTFYYPHSGLWFDENQFIIADSGNNRVLIWNSFPSTNFQPADVVIGQDDFYSTTCDTTAAHLCSPKGVFLHDDKLIVSDKYNFRYLIFQGQGAAD